LTFTHDLNHPRGEFREGGGIEKPTEEEFRTPHNSELPPEGSSGDPSTKIHIANIYVSGV